jgi:ubiquinone/menaquinone biosynthesis C-methylase UbiE
MTDPATYRRHSRDRWARSAPGWQARRDAFRQATMPVSSWMVEAVDPQPGQDVLELAAGLGDTGFLAAELIAPTGTLICTDFVPEMLTAAQARAAELGIANVRFRLTDAESLDQDAASLDAVLCRWGYMLMADPGAALRETRRVLRAGGRVALAAWTAPRENPWSADPARELTRRGLYEPPVPGEPGQFAWAREGTVAEPLEEGGS